MLQPTFEDQQRPEFFADAAAAHFGFAVDSVAQTGDGIGSKEATVANGGVVEKSPGEVAIRTRGPAWDGRVHAGLGAIDDLVG